MSETTTIHQKLVNVRKYVKDQNPSKDAENEHSKYFYFTPEFIENLVTEACETENCMCLCDLMADEFGYYQRLRFFEVTKPDDFIECQLRTKHGEITATNAAQQMGGTDTYSERYVKMKFFCIKDNNIDPDAQDQTKGKKKAAGSSTQNNEVKEWFNPKNGQHMDALESYRASGMSGEDIVKKIRSTPGLGISRVNADKIIKGEI